MKVVFYVPMDGGGLQAFKNLVLEYDDDKVKIVSVPISHKSHPNKWKVKIETDTETYKEFKNDFDKIYEDTYKINKRKINWNEFIYSAYFIIIAIHVSLSVGLMFYLRIINLDMTDIRFFVEYYLLYILLFGGIGVHYSIYKLSNYIISKINKKLTLDN